MPTLDELEEQLRDLVEEASSYAPGGALVAGYEQEHADLLRKAETVRRQIRELATPHSLMSMKAEGSPQMPNLSELRARLQNLDEQIQTYAPGGVVNPKFAQDHADAQQRAEAVRRQIQELTAPRPQPESVAVGENVFYRQFVERAQTARQERRWDDALKNVDNALAFATGGQLQELEDLRAAIRADRQRVADEEADQKTTALMKEARELARANRYAAALDKINEALKTARPARRAEVEVARDDLARSQSELSNVLQGGFEAALGRHDFGEAERIITTLTDVSSSTATLAEYRKRLAIAREAQNIREVLSKLRAELEIHWKKGTLPAAREARRKAEAAAATYANVAEFESLVQEVRRQEEEFAKREDILTTSLATGEFLRAIEELKGWQTLGATELPRYTITAVYGPEGRLEPQVSQALQYDPADVAIANLTGQIGRYNARKANEYLERAKPIYTVNPKQAERSIREALGFGLLPDDSQDALRNFLDTQVLPRVRLRDEIDREANTAAQLLDPLQGWARLNAAAVRDPAAPSVKHVRDELRPAMATALTRELELCERDIKNKRWPEAETRAVNLCDLVRGDPGLASFYERADTLRQQAERLQQLRRELDALRTEMTLLIQNSPADAAGRLEKFQQAAGPLQSYFPEVGAWNDSISARRNYRAALVAIEADHRTLTQKQLEERLERLARLDADLGKTDESKEVRRRLELRRKFLLAEQYYEAGGSFRKEAEKWLDEITEGEDAAKAAEYLGEIEKQRQRSKLAAEALEEAADKAKQNDFSQAIKTLEKWREQPDDLGERIRESIRSYRSSWRERLVTQLKVIVEAMQGENDWVAPLEQIETRVKELKELTPLEGADWEQKYMPTIYRAIAGRMLRAGGAEGPDAALKLLDKALRLAPEAEDLKRERRTAARTLAVQKARHAEQSTVGAEAIWKEFLATYPDDPQALCESGRLAMEGGNFPLALRYLEAAQHYDQAQGGKLQEAIQQARAKTEEAQRISEEKQKIESALAEMNTIFQYVSAENVLKELAATYPRRKKDLDIWFAGRRAELIESLSRKLKALPIEAPERWEVALKILHFDPQASDAHAEVGRALIQIQRLEDDTDALVKDLTGPIHHEVEEADGKRRLVEVEAQHALDLQIEQAQKLQERAYNLKNLLDEQARSLGQAPQEQGTAGQCVTNINARLKGLNQLALLMRQARATLRGARQAAFAVRRADGNEDPFVPVANLLGDVLNLPVSFAQHVTVQALNRDLADARYRYQAIKSVVGRLQSALGDEDFDAALECVADILELDEPFAQSAGGTTTAENSAPLVPSDGVRKPEMVVVKTGDFNVRQNIRIRAPWTDKELRLVGQLEDDGLDGLRGQLTARQAQWRRAFAWQKPMGLVGWSPGKPVPADCLRLSWTQHGASECESRLRRGLFDEARQSVEEAVGDGSSVTRDGRWSLRRCQRYLADPGDAKDSQLDELMEPEKALSHKMKSLIEARRQALREIEADIQRLVGPRGNGELPELEQIRRADEDFYDYWNSIGDLLRQLQPQGLFKGISRNERAHICGQLTEVVNAAREIAPDYAGWAAVKPQIQEACPGV